MLLVLLLWVYVVIICLVWGLSVNSLLNRLLKENTPHPGGFVVNVLLGMMVVTGIGMVLSLAMPLNGISHLIMLAITAGTGCLLGKKLRMAVSFYQEQLRRTRWYIYVLTALFTTVYAYISFAPSSHFDDGLYYSTTIKCIEEFGTVKGIANINPRIALNSSWHVLQAVFGMRFLGLGLFNELNGLMLVLLFLYSMGGVNGLEQGNYSRFNIIKSLFLLLFLPFHFTASSNWLLYNVNFIGSSTPDFPVTMLVLFVGLLFLERAFSSDFSTKNDWMVLVLPVWMITIKLSALPVFLLSLFCLLNLLRKKYYAATGMALCMGILFIVPWFIRNILVSGYLVFPISAIDWFNVPWKLPVAHVDWFANSVITFVLGADLNTTFTTPFYEWMPAWYRGLEPVKKILLVACLFGILVWPLLVGVFRKVIQLPEEHRKRLWWFYGYAVFALVFWAVNAPDFRFGYGFILSFLSFVLVSFVTHQGKKVRAFSLLCMVLILLINYKDVLKYFSGRLLEPPLVYRLPEKMRRETMPGGAAITLVDNMGCWNAPLPVASEGDYISIKPRMLGTEIRDGFRAAGAK